MWQPSRGQWTIIYLVSLVAVLGWPPSDGRSLGVTLVNWAADPGRTLPDPPASLPMALDDDGDAVAEHDMLETAYLDARARSATTRLRMDLKEAVDPLPAATGRQVLVGLVVAGALAVWRMESSRAR